MIKRVPEIFTQPFEHWEKVDFFRKVLYAFLLFNALTLLPIAYEAFGYNGIVGATGWNTAYPWYKLGSKALLNVLSHPLNASNTWIMYVFVFGQIITLITGLFNFLPKISAVLIYFFTVNLFLKGYLMFTGGEVLISILLFYFIFIQRSNSGRGEPITFSPLQNLLNNTFYWVVLIQICLVYVMSTLYKLNDPAWVNGDALMYISRVDVFSGGFMRLLFEDNPTLSMIGTYGVLLYQGLFPLLIWVKKIKVPYLILGVIIHLMIALAMGIFTFGIVMIITYILFLDQGQVKGVKNRLRIRKIKEA